jgi:alpha-D-ribose 1-methylphosphonate 5-triphosphate synthase subunit PhnL
VPALRIIISIFISIFVFRRLYRSFNAVLQGHWLRRADRLELRNLPDWHQLAIRRHALPYLCRQFIEGLRGRCHRLSLHEEPFLASGVHHRRGARRTIGRRKRFPRRNDGQIPGYDPSLTKSPHANRFWL